MHCLRLPPPSRLPLLIALLCLSQAIHAQKEAPARFQLYGGYSFLSNSIDGLPGSHQSLSGWDASLAFPAWHGLRFKAGTFGYRGTNLGAPQHPYFVMGGAEFSHRVGRETIYVEGMGGDSGINRNWGPNGINGETASFATLLGGGLDTPITRRIAFRAGGDFLYENYALSGDHSAPYRIPGLPQFFGRITSGLVLKF